MSNKTMLYAEDLLDIVDRSIVNNYHNTGIRNRGNLLMQEFSFTEFRSELKKYINNQSQQTENNRE